jgi:ribosomal protein S27E
MTIVERAAYLKGLTEGLGIDPNSGEGKLWSTLTELLGDMAHQVEELRESFEDQDEVLDDVYEQLIYLQEAVLPTEELTDYDEEDDESDEDEEEDKLYTPSLRLYEGDEDGEDEESGPDGEDEELDYDGVLYDVTCPGCGETITFDEETLDKGSIRCPNCGETLEFDLGGDEE